MTAVLSNVVLSVCLMGLFAASCFAQTDPTKNVLGPSPPIELNPNPTNDGVIRFEGDEMIMEWKGRDSHGQETFLRNRITIVKGDLHLTTENQLPDGTTVPGGTVTGKRSTYVVHVSTSKQDVDDKTNEQRLTLKSCEDTNVNFFLPSSEARALVPSVVGAVVVTPLFGGNTTPLNIAHFHCTDVSDRSSINFALARFPLKPSGHYVMWVLTDSAEFHKKLRSRGIESHLVGDASLDIADKTWTTKWGGEFSAYSVAAHQNVTAPISHGQIDWVFRGSRGIVHITGSYSLLEEFLDRDPIVNVPNGSVLRQFFERSRGNTALTHRNSLDLTLKAPQ